MPRRQSPSSSSPRSRSGSGARSGTRSSGTRSARSGQKVRIITGANNASNNNNNSANSPVSAYVPLAVTKSGGQVVKIYVPDTRRARSAPSGGGGGGSPSGIPRLAKEKAAAEAVIAEIQGELAMLKMQRQNLLGGAALPAGFGANAAARLAAAQAAAQQSNYRIVSASGMPVSLVSPALVASSGISPSAAIGGSPAVSAGPGSRSSQAANNRFDSQSNAMNRQAAASNARQSAASNARQSAANAREAANAQRRQNAEARQSASAQRQQNAEERKSAAANARTQQQQERASANAEAKSQAMQQAGESRQAQQQQRMEIQSQREQAKIQSQQEAQSAAMQARQEAMSAATQSRQSAQEAAMQSKQQQQEAAMQRQSSQQNMQSQAMQARMQTQQEAQSAAIQGRQSAQQQVMEQQSARVQAAMETQSSARQTQQQMQQEAASASIQARQEAQSAAIQARQEAVSSAQRAKNNIRNSVIQRQSNSAENKRRRLSEARNAEQERKNDERSAVSAQKIENAKQKAEFERNKKALTYSTKMQAEVERLTGSKTKPPNSNGSNPGGSNHGGSNHGGSPRINMPHGIGPHIGPGGTPHVGPHIGPGGTPHVGPHIGPGGTPHVGPRVGPGIQQRGPVPSWVVNSSPVSWRTVLQIPVGTTPTSNQIKQRAAAMLAKGRTIGDRRIRNIYVQRVEIAERQALRDVQTAAKSTANTRADWKRVLGVSVTNRTIENFRKRYDMAKARTRDPAARNRVEKAWATVQNLVARKQISPPVVKGQVPRNRVPFTGNEPLTHLTQQRLHDAMKRGVPAQVIRSIIAGNEQVRTRGSGGQGTKRLPAALQQQLKSHTDHSDNALLNILKKAKFGGGSAGPSARPAGSVAASRPAGSAAARPAGSAAARPAANVRLARSAQGSAASNGKRRQEAAAIANVEAARRSPQFTLTTKKRLADAERKLAHNPQKLEQMKRAIIAGNETTREREQARAKINTKRVGKLVKAEILKAGLGGRDPKFINTAQIKRQRELRAAAIQAKRKPDAPYQKKRENRQASIVLKKAIENKQKQRSAEKYLRQKQEQALVTERKHRAIDAQRAQAMAQRMTSRPFFKLRRR